MKKICSVLLALLLALTLVSCGKDIEPAPVGPDPGSENITLQEPVMNWFYIKTNTGINTLLMEIENPNGCAVDVDLNVEYYKDGEKIGTSEELFACCIAPKEKALLWDTWEVPDSADSVKLSFVNVESSSWTPVESTVFRAEEREGYLDLDVKPSESVFIDACVTVVFFKEGVPVAFGLYSFYDLGSSAQTVEAPEPYDEYVIYANIYK